ncbi:hypothetical protein CEXT_463141 [Caerostris extrusa]|uniref:Uncharacterized protein n=1 Tax=Caerostris extrusa TaxID=172846 RepID=A0AAV4NW28_CAEEX|nr:hypothetical protein CEXT_463141 [Caerostris extrusa]
MMENLLPLGSRTMVKTFMNGVPHANKSHNLRSIKIKFTHLVSDDFRLPPCTYKLSVRVSERKTALSKYRTISDCHHPLINFPRELAKEDSASGCRK